MFTQTILIASVKAPTKETFPVFVDELRRVAHKFDATVNRIGATDGPGCANITIEITATKRDAEDYANNITMALMPARWAFTQDEPLDGYHLTK